MNISSSTSQPTNPYHIARAYGLPNSRPVQTPQQTQATQPATATKPVSAVTPVQEVRVAAEVQPIQRIGRRPQSENVQNLVAAAVPGRVDFHEDGTATPAAGADGSGGGGGALPFYRHPADRNSAATAITMGRSLDIRG